MKALTKHKTPLTSTEIGVLWTQYMADTMSLCVEKYSVAKEEDEQARLIYQDTVSLYDSTIAQIRQIFQNEGIPLPMGFTNEDVNLDAPPLYSDIYRLQYCKFTKNLRMAANGLIMAESTRADVRKLFKGYSISTMDLDERVTNLLLERGLYIRAPYITVGEKSEFVHSQTFMGNYFNGGERKLLAMEIGTLFSNIRNNIMGKILLTGFCQVAKSPEVREYMRRGVDISSKHIQIFSELLREEDIPIPMSSDLGVTNSMVAPFSDKLMLYHTTMANQIGLAAYGTATTASMRKDLQACYMRLAAEVGQYTADGANILIENNWLEEPPEAVDHRELSFLQ
jgi:ribosomal protein S8E